MTNCHSLSFAASPRIYAPLRDPLVKRISHPILLPQSTMRSPVLFLIFNRPEPARRVFEIIRKAEPPRLYVAADGPRRDRSTEPELCNETREVTARVDWPCQIQRLYRDRNLGCKKAVSEAVDWFFDREQEGIILEDDCLPDPSFFLFCDELLQRYREDQTVGIISGNNFQFGRTYGDASYYFSRYAHIWGWASWRRVWQYYDRDATCWPQLRADGRLESIFDSRREIRHWRRAFDAVRAGKVDAWSYNLVLTLWAKRMACVLPQKNLVQNIGFGRDATHTVLDDQVAQLAPESMDFPLRHPQTVATCTPADRYTSRALILPSLPKRVFRRIRLLRRRLAT